MSVESAPQDSSDAVDGLRDTAMSAEQLAEAKQYNRQKLGWSLVDLAISLAYLTMAAFVLARPVDDWLATFPVLENRWLRLAAFFALLSLGGAVLSWPLEYYTGHVLEHRYGLSNQSFAAWLWRWAKQGLLALVLGALLMEGLYLVIALTGPWWWLAAALAFFLVTVVLGQLAPVIVLPLFYKVERVQNEELTQGFAKLAEGTSLNVEGVYRMAMSEETVKANAMLAGLGRTRRVILGDTLLENFSRNELDVIFAHEVGHHVFHHLPKMLALGLIYSAAGFYLANAALRWRVGEINYAELPVSALPLLLLALSLFSLLLGPLQNALSRRFERQCDRYALERTRDRTSYRSAFHKLAQQNKADPDPPRWEVVFFHDHPPIAERVKMAD